MTNIKHKQGNAPQQKLRRYRLIGIAALFMAAAGLLVNYHGFRPQNADTGTQVLLHRFRVNPVKTKVHLYFADPGERFLTAEDRMISQPGSVVDRARRIVSALIDGPEGPLTPTVPPETRLLALYVTQDGTAYADFDRAITEKHPGGTYSELLTIFSITNTLALNLPEIQAVKILIEGREAKTLAGHIDIRFPFRPNMLMIK